MPILTGCARAGGGIVAPVAWSSTAGAEVAAATAPSEGGEGAVLDDAVAVVVSSPSFVLWMAVSDDVD